MPIPDARQNIMESALCQGISNNKSYLLWITLETMAGAVRLRILAELVRTQISSSFAQKLAFNSSMNSDSTGSLFSNHL